MAFEWMNEWNVYSLKQLNTFMNEKTKWIELLSGYAMVQQRFYMHNVCSAKLSNGQIVLLIKTKVILYLTW